LNFTSDAFIKSTSTRAEPLCVRGKLFHPVKILLENLPVFQAGDFALERFVDLGFLRVLGRLVDLVENAEVAGERFAREFVGREFVGHVVRLGDFVEHAAFARVARVERAFVKFHAFAQAFDEAETVVIHRGLHHLQHVVRVRVRRARDERGAGGDRLLHRVDRIIHRAPLVGLALETERRRGRSLFLRQAINPVVHDTISQLDVLARGVVEMISADGKGVAVTAENEHVQVRPRKRNTARERQRATVNIMCAVGLHEIRKTAGAADASDGGDFLVPHLALFDQLEIKGKHGKVAAAGTPRRMVGGDFFFGQALAFLQRRHDGRIDNGDVASVAVRNFSCCGHKNLVSHRQRFFGSFADHLFEKFNRLVERVKTVIVSRKQWCFG